MDPSILYGTPPLLVCEKQLLSLATYPKCTEGILYTMPLVFNVNGANILYLRYISFYNFFFFFGVIFLFTCLNSLWMCSSHFKDENLTSMLVGFNFVCINFVNEFFYFSVSYKSGTSRQYSSKDFWRNTGGFCSKMLSMKKWLKIATWYKFTLLGTLTLPNTTEMNPKKVKTLNNIKNNKILYCIDNIPN